MPPRRMSSGASEASGDEHSSKSPLRVVSSSTSPAMSVASYTSDALVIAPVRPAILVSDDVRRRRLQADPHTILVCSALTSSHLPNLQEEATATIGMDAERFSRRSWRSQLCLQPLQRANEQIHRYLRAQCTKADLTYWHCLDDEQWEAA